MSECKDLREDKLSKVVEEHTITKNDVEQMKQKLRATKTSKNDVNKLIKELETSVKSEKNIIKKILGDLDTSEEANQVCDTAKNMNGIQKQLENAKLKSKEYDNTLSELQSNITVKKEIIKNLQKQIVSIKRKPCEML